MNTPPRLTHRTRKYSPNPGDEFLPVTDIRPEHRARIFEARFDDGTGTVGKLADAEQYLLNGVIMLRFDGEQLGIICTPDPKRGGWPQLLMKPDGYTIEDARTDYGIGGDDVEG